MRSELTHPENNVQHMTRAVGLVLGPLLFVLTLIFTPLSADMPESAWYVAGLATWMAIWWITEAVPIPVTSFLPIIVAPLIGLASLKQATASFAHPLIFLFLGGFILSLAMERWHLHRRIALITMLAVGDKPSRQIGGLMFITAFLSMWMSNTATAVMMLPIALSIIEMKKHSANHQQFSAALLLGIAYSASIGGVGTLIGTPPNALLAAYLADNYGIELGFGRWMMLGVPIAMVFLWICWLWLTRHCSAATEHEHSETRAMLSEELSQMGPLSVGEKAVSLVFITTAMAWIFRPLLASWSGVPLSDTGIAMCAALVLFLLPVNWSTQQMVMDWHTAKRLPWGVLMLFGGGLSLAALIKLAGLADYIGQSLGQTVGLSPVWVILIVTAAIIFLTEITSNTATAAGFLPILGPIAVSMGSSPLMLVVPAALAASCAFMMPVATPPNSIVFASGQLKIKQMVRAGFILNIVAILLISAVTYILVIPIFG